MCTLKTTLKAFGLFILTALAFACSDDDNGSFVTPITEGAAVTVGNGKAYAFIKRNADGSPSEIGVNFNEASISGLPTHNQSFVLPMPANNNTLINHIIFDYITEGSSIDDAYNAPHFAVRYYMISAKDREAITANDAKLGVLPAADFIPKNYSADGNEAARGKGWTDSTAPEFNGKAFQSAIVYSSYNGKFIAISPLIDMAFIKTKPSTTTAVPQMAKVQQTGLYPQAVTIMWEKDDQSYSTSLSALTLRAE